MFLNRNEIQELTQRTRRDAQIRQLRSMGIYHRIDGDGFPVILEAHILKEFDGGQESGNKKGQPNWNNM